MKISILLPYKENFSHVYAGAVSLFVKDTSVKSSFFKDIKIYGNTKYKKRLLTNYINLELNKSFFESGSKVYVDKFLEYEQQNGSDLIEIHNRPNYVKFLIKKVNSKIILYFHNDPLSMNGSKSIKDRMFLLNNTDHLIFNSKWSRNRFFVGLNENLRDIKKISVVYQSAEKTIVNFKKKRKLISFVGKLNTAKGYDLFGKAIIKVLDKYKDWNAIVVGDEPREKLVFNHPNLKIMGFQKHNTVLKIYDQTSIAVVCSRWNEPFGRTSLEASSRGCAVIISNRGGLPETTEHPVILRKLTSNEIFLKIKNLIDNKKLRTSIQKKNIRDFKFTHEFISKSIDHIRNNSLRFLKLNLVLNKQNQKYKILHITNFNERHDGRLHYNTGRRINNGFIRNGHNVLTISDRDIISKNKSFKDFSGKTNLNDKILNCFNNFNPNVIVLGHADGVDINVLDQLKTKNQNLRISQWFLDPVSINGPDYLRNKSRILDKDDICDANFLTTNPTSLNFKIKNSYFIPNPCDEAFEVLHNYNQKCEMDLFFAMSHGVHRGNLKKGKKDNREIFLNKLMKKCKNIKFDLYGMNNIQPIWGQEFLNKISNSKMGLNLSRGKPIKYYSSDRIAQLLGNGLLTFIDERTQFNDFLDKDHVVYYKEIDDLKYKIDKYKKDTKARNRIAKKGKAFYFKNFNSNLVAKFILDKTFDVKSSKKIIWDI